MKIGMLVGAVGLALTGVATGNSSSLPVSEQTALSQKANAPVWTDAANIAAAREAAIGVPGSQKFRSNVARIKRGIADGSIDPRRVLFDASALDLKTDEDHALPSSVSVNSDGVLGGGSSRGIGDGQAISGTNYDYFDGFESYGIDPNPADNVFPAAGRFSAVPQPSGIPATSSSMFVQVQTPVAQFQDGVGFTYSPATPTSPAVTVNAPWNADRDAAVPQVLMDGRGSRFAGGGGHLAGNFLGFRAHWGRQSGGVVLPSPAGGTPYVATPARDLIVAIDYFLGDYETEVLWSPSSNLEGFIISRYYLSGVIPGDALADPDGRIRRPLMLGLFPNNFTIGQFYKTPTLGGVGQPPTFVTKLNEWFTVALRLTIGNELSWWVRDSGTNGSGTILIDDSRNFAFLETGWAELMPGQAPGAATPMGPVTMWRGYGRAIDEFGAQGPAISFAPAGLSTDNGWTLITRGPADTLPAWKPTNHFMDNMGVIGTRLETPPLPKLRLPYKDDIERYTANQPLRFQGGRWTDNLSSGASISIDFNSTVSPPPDSTGSNSPNQSILSRSILEDSSMRQEFFTDVPPGALTAVDFDPTNRAFARPGFPVRVSAMVRNNGISAVRAMVVTDNDVDASTEFLLQGASDSNDIVTNRYFIRLPNPVFDRTLPTSSNARVDDLPVLAANTVNINYTTTSTITQNTFNKLELVMYGDGTCEWHVNNAALTFDGGFYTTDSRLQDELKKAKRIALGLPASTPLSDPALNPPYTRFLSVQRTLDQVDFWSGNNVGSFNQRIYVDDLMVNAVVRVPGPGPAFALDYCDDMSLYNLDESVGGQGTSPFGALQAVLGVEPGNIRGRWVNAATFPGAVDSCLYTVQEVIANGGVWSVVGGSTIQVRKPFVGYVCPARENIAGLANMTVIDPAAVTPRAPLVVRVGAASNVNNNGSGATVRTDDDRYDASSFFCRYTLTSLVVLPDVSSGGSPFPMPAGVANGNILAIDAPFGLNALTGIRACPGTITSGLGVATPFRLFDIDKDLTATGNLTLATGNIAANPCGTGESVGNASNNTPNSDTKGLQFVIQSTPRWTDFTQVSFAAGGFGGDSWVRNSQSELDDVKTAALMTDTSIDPSGAFGRVVGFINNNAFGPDADGFSSAAVALPSAVAAAAAGPDPAKVAGIYFDVYIQDTNNRWVFSITGAEADCNGGADFVTAVRMGGPNGQSLPQGTIHIAQNVGLDTFADTGVAFPIGAWFRVGLELDHTGNWDLGINTLGAPGGPAGNDEGAHYALPGTGAPHANAVFVASGASLGTSDITSALINRIGGLTVIQGFDNEGDGVVTLGRVTVEALDRNATRPAGLGAMDFCFYQVTLVDGTPVGPTIRDINPATGVAGATRLISSSSNDIIAVRFQATAPVVSSFAQCPRNGTFAFANSGANPGTGVDGTQGEWVLTGVPDVETSSLPPVGGISNAAGPNSGQGYNSPNLPARNILLARFVTIPPVPAEEIQSKMWFDNLCLRVRPLQAPCPADLNGDGQVNSADLAFLLGAWGPCPGCPADLDGNGLVNSADLGSLLGSWGPC